jgi:hypothetical protein
VNWSERDEAIQELLLDQWTDTALSWEFWGELYEPKIGTAYIVPSVVGEDGGQSAKAGMTNFYRYTAMLRFAGYFPLSTPTSTAKTAMETMAALFRGKHLDGIGRFRTPTLTGPARDGAWRILIVDCPFERDEHEEVS